MFSERLSFYILCCTHLSPVHTTICQIATERCSPTVAAACWDELVAGGDLEGPVGSSRLVHPSIVWGRAVCRSVPCSKLTNQLLCALLHQVIGVCDL